MSRRRGEFEHRTSLFEGAYRAWSHLGGLDPEDVFHKTTFELDPLNMAKHEGKPVQKEWPYEPLPRTGLEHPYVKAILRPWLGTDAENDEEVEQGLSTLRNWWQHRRKGESRSALNALGTDKMRGVVDGYTRHFFALAHGLVKDCQAQPPKSLVTKMGTKKSKKKSKRRKSEHSEDEEEVGEIMTAMASSAAATARPTAVPPALLARTSLSGTESITKAGLAKDNFSDTHAATAHGYGSGGLAIDNVSSLELLLQQHQRRPELDILDLAQLSRQRQLLAGSSVLTPLEQLHLAQRQRHFALVNALLPTSPSSHQFPHAQGLGTYAPASWLLERPQLPIDEKTSS
mmetsp:Transcript_14459/g.23450  ORF Transcript_14459/g.23450 Transcript_14459/m.23450 type:complete len:344 (+) Transcript_14459:527-1558(+)